MSNDFLGTPLMDRGGGGATSGASAQDPFYVVKDELQSKVGYIQVKYERFDDLLHNANTTASAEFRELRKALGKEVRAAASQLKDLKMTVDFVEKDRTNFAHVDDRELSDRRQFIKELKSKLEAIKAGLNGDAARSKIEADTRREAERNAASDRLGAASAGEMENTRFIHDQQTRQQLIMREQDDNIEQLDHAVDRVQNIALEIQDELEVQNRMLNEVDRDMDEASDAMGMMMGKLGKLLKTKDNCQIWSVIILTLTLIALIFAVLYI